MDNRDLRGIKVLTTNHYLTNFSGSELATFYISKELKELGCEVTVAALSCGSPLRELFEAEGINIVNLLKEKLTCKNFDLIWAHHTPVLQNCLFESNITAKTIIFSSMSPFEPLEAPPVYANMLSLCLANSFETKDKLVEEGVYHNKIHIFNNSVDDFFFTNFIKLENKKLKKLCIISNHVPSELIELTHILKENNVDYDIYGMGHKFEHITPVLLKNYDAIITIGRSVQYGLAMGIPVYCYDRFGGPGYINSNNINISEYYNFSGRCCNRKLSAEEIYKELVSKYRAALLECEKLHLLAFERYSLRNNILCALDKAFKKPVNLDIIKKHYNMNKRIYEYYEKELRNDEIKDNIINQITLEKTHLYAQLESIYNSKGWKLLSSYYKLKNLIAKKLLPLTPSDF